MTPRILVSALLVVAVLGQGEGFGFELFKKEQETNPVICDVCKVLYGELVEFLKEDSKQILASLDEICDELPKDLTKICRTIVDEYGPLIVDTLESLDPEAFCTDVGLCSAVVESELPQGPVSRILCFIRKSFKSNLNQIMIREALGNEFLCNTCDEVVFMLHEALTDRALLDEIADLLAEGCAICPVEEQCRTFFENLPGLIIEFANEYLTNETCSVLGLCQSAAPIDPMTMFSRYFDDILPDDLDTDFFPGFPGRKPRPRPNNEPAPRRHPWRGHFNHTRHDHNGTHPNRTHHTPGRDHTPDRDHTPERDHHSRDWNRPMERPFKPYRPYPHPRPYPRPYPHHNPHHPHRPEHRPFPGFRPWWTDDMTPEVPVPEEPVPEEPVPEEPVPEKPVPEEPVPEDIPEIPTLDVEPIAQRDGLRLEDPFNFRRERLPNPRVERPRKPSFETRKGAGTKGFGKRRQRSVSINTVVNTGDFDATNTFEVDPVNEETEGSWKCDICEHELNVIREYLTEHKAAITEKLEVIADMICDRLPSTSAEECKDEVTAVLPDVVDLLLEYYLTADRVCTALKLC